MDIEITTARNRIADTLLNGNDTISYRDIEAASLPVFVKVWFHLGVETWYLPEYARRTDWTHFDYTNASVQQTQAEYDRAVKNTARFSREACEQIIEGALRHEMAYVKQPVDAVTGILFKRSEVIEGIHVVDFLSQFQREPYYASSLQTYVSKHEDSRLDQDLLEQILVNAEQEAYETRPYETFRTAVSAVADMLGIITDNDRLDHISGDIWSSFIEYRQIHQLNPVLAETLDRLKLEPNQSLTPDELLGKESPHPASPEETDAEDTVALADDIPIVYKASEEDFEEETEAPVDDLEAEADTPAAAPKSFEETPAVTEIDTESAIPQDSPIADDTIQSMVDEQVQGEEKDEMDRVEKVAITNTPMAPSQVNISIPTVEISKKLEKMFVKKLFNNNMEEYQEGLSRLENAVSWDEAFNIIEAIWQERGLNLFSKESQEFTRVFYQRYYPLSDGPF